MLALDAETRIALSPTILLRSLPEQGHFLAFDIAGGDHFRLNRTSFWILEAIGTGIRWADLLAQFLRTFGISYEEGEADLTVVVGQFLHEKVVRRLSDGQEGQQPTVRTPCLHQGEADDVSAAHFGCGQGSDL